LLQGGPGIRYFFASKRGLDISFFPAGRGWDKIFLSCGERLGLDLSLL